jgi:general nucleoside transport system permease protein
MWDIISGLFPYAIAFTVPLLAAALGGFFSERGGVVNIGLEGLMVIGNFVCAVVISRLQGKLGTGAIWLGLAFSAAAGMVFSALHAFASISLSANQVISGTAINMVASALTVFLARTMTGSGNVRITLGFIPFDVPVLSAIPIIGPLFFTKTYATTWLMLAILALSWFVMYRTRFGLRLRACGEHPHAADAAGINVFRMRYAGVLISGALAGLSGGAILVTFSGEFNGTVAGLGFLALAALIFGNWKPLGILGATFFFGFAATLANVSQVVPAVSKIPGLVLKAFPYVVTILALVFFSKTTQAPKADGEIYDAGKR